MRLIDADELKKKSRCIKIGETGRRSALLKNWVVSEFDINSVPTIEAEPVKHGEWIIGEFDIPHCSVCGEKMLEFAVSKYCPFCGAKMDLEEDE